MSEGIVRFLKNELSERKSRNPSYSIRSFANYLGLDQSLLSKILNQRRKPSKNVIQKISSQLGYVEELEEKSTFNVIQEDIFLSMAKWYYYAILELFKSDGPLLSATNVSKRLKLDEITSIAALDRLSRLGFIEKSDEGQWQIKKENNSWANVKNTSTEKMNLVKDLNLMSAKAVKEIPFEKRDHTTLTIAINPDDLDLIKDKIRYFRRGLDQFIQKRKNYKEVYQLVIGFFPLSD